MVERLSPSKIETAKQASRSFEKAWRVFTHPGKYPQDEVEKACSYLMEQKGSLKLSIDDMEIGGGIEPEIYNSIFLGIYHHGITLPELKHKPLNLN